MISLAQMSAGLVSVGALFLGLVTLMSNHRQWANRLFAMLSGLVSLFVAMNYLVDADPARGLLWARGTFFLAVFMAWAMLAFILNFPRRTIKRAYDHLALVVALPIAALCFSPAFIPRLQPAAGKLNVVPGPLYGLFLAYILIIFGGTAVAIYFTMSRASHKNRERIELVASGLGISALILLATNFLIPLAVGSDGSSNFGPFALIVFIGTTTFAIVRQHLFDIRLVVARSIAYILLLITLSVGYIAVAFGVSQLLFGDAQAPSGQLFVYAGLSLVLAFIFQPLRRGFEHLTDRIFFRDQYDARDILDAISRILVSELNLDRIMSRSLDTLCREMRVEFGQLVIFNDDRVYRIEHFGPLPRRLMIAPELRRLGTGMLVADELTGGERKELLESHGVRLSLGLRTGEEFVGYLLLGDKLSGSPYAKSDLQLLALLGKELAVGISNAKSYAEIQEFNRTLQDRINHATSRLRVANRHLKELDKTKDEFISMASHQLRTPLTTIKGYLSMMAEGDAGRMSATQKEFIGYAFDASERMVNLISDLLNVSRLEAGRFLIQTAPTDIVALVADEVRQLQSHAKNKNIYLNFIPPTVSVPIVELDENKTRQVIMNFIDNAIYYTKTGGVTVQLRQIDDRVRLEVSDTGIGVPESAKKKLFAKFYRAENAQTVRPDGTGLGLYLARRVIADQGGTIIFSSTEGKGSTFGFELPFKAVKMKGHA